jgi:hypothetical protein
VCFLERGEFHISHGASATKAAAIAFAEEVRRLHGERGVDGAAAADSASLNGTPTASGF